HPWPIYFENAVISAADLGNSGPGFLCCFAAKLLITVESKIKYVTKYKGQPGELRLCRPHAGQAPGLWNRESPDFDG
ncbi:MAG TPA: hypothetical protein VLH40_01295, partial [Atribacteraceae bacterium]|nr:hypothetical protein [Atribacteraceae bacterium]